MRYRLFEIFRPFFAHYQPQVRTFSSDIIKPNGVIVRREAQTFDRRRAACAWAERQEKEMKSPDELMKRETRSLTRSSSATASRSTAKWGAPKTAAYARLPTASCQLKCSEATSDRLVEFAKTLGVLPQTRRDYLLHFSPIYDVAELPGSIRWQRLNSTAS